MSIFIRKKMYLLFFHFALFSSCKTHYDCVLKVNGPVNGISQNSEVLFMNNVIGQVSSIRLSQTNNVFYINLSIDKRVRISREGNFSIVDTDFFGGKGIQISNVLTESIISDGDTISISFDTRLPSDSLQNMVKTILDSLVRNR